MSDATNERPGKAGLDGVRMNRDSIIRHITQPLAGWMATHPHLSGAYHELVSRLECLMDTHADNLRAIHARQADELVAAKNRLAEIDAGVKADAEDLAKMRDGTKLTRAGVVEIIVYQQQDIATLAARLAEVEGAGVEAAITKSVVEMYDRGLFSGVADCTLKAVEILRRNFATTPPAAGDINSPVEETEITQ